ncbi:MAG: hypothetical protein IIB41_05200 [Candidatus Marinimicrobia bacterium]|nr:hypothetical protein [Candidatus Neomarinimicrobiota bacterium]
MKPYLMIGAIPFSSNLFSRTLPIIMEGEFSDWESISIVYRDAIGDVLS